jgi:uncharacterized membrane protein
MTTTTTGAGEREAALGTPALDVAAKGTSAVGLAGSLLRRLFAAVREEAMLVAVLVVSFVARWLLANRNSYWLDELYSVAIYGIWNDNVAAAVDRLSHESVHPPLYQAVLYGWMELFGDDERATRSLSNLYITLATLFLYLLVRDALSRAVALWTAVTFVVMYTPLYFALETRSYAQTMFLTALSSYALIRLMRVAAVRGWRPALFSPTAALFAGANIALLLTHYFNAFFYVAQGAIAGIFVLRTFRPRRWLAGLGAVAAVYGVQGTVFALIWGDVLIDTARARAGSYPVEEEGLHSPLALLNSLVTPNIDAPRPIWLIALSVLAVVVGRAVMVVAGGRELTAERQRSWSVLYLLAWLVFPMLVMFLAFLVTGTARYNARYVLYAMPALAPLVVLTVGEAARLVSVAWRRVRGTGLDAAVLTSVGMAVAILTLVIPRTPLALGPPDISSWRSTARTIVETIDANPDSTFVVFDTAFRRTSVLDYYLARYSDDVRVASVILLGEERRNQGFSFEGQRTQIEQYDFIIVAFTHHRIGQFPHAVRTLSKMYPLYLRQLDWRGRGLVIFAVHPRDGPHHHRDPQVRTEER